MSCFSSVFAEPHTQKSMYPFFSSGFWDKNKHLSQMLIWEIQTLSLICPACVVSTQNAMFEDTCQTIAIISHSVGVCEEKANTRQVYSQGSGLYLSQCLIFIHCLCNFGNRLNILCHCFFLITHEHLFFKCYKKKIHHPFYCNIN